MSDILRDFDKKNKIPKVKLNLPKFDFSHLTEAVRNMNSAFENMTKDIRERQDNAIAMEFTKCIGELLKKNGVTPKITEYTRENVKEHSIEQLYGVSIDELDFSEHDKQFKERIGFLTRKNEELFDENASLKQRIAELESENEKLFEYLNGITGNTKAEIKNNIKNIEKIDKKPTKRTGVIIAKEINGQTYVKLDDFMSVVNDLQAEIGT